MLIARLLLHIALSAAPSLAWQSHTDFNDINQLAVDTSGMVICGASNGGAFRYSAADTALLGHVTNIDGLPVIEATAVAFAPDNRAWVGTNGGGISAWSGGHIAAGRPINSTAGLRSDTIFALLHYQGGAVAERLVAGMPGALALIDAADGAVLRNYTSAQGYPLRKAVRALALRHDSLWVGTDSGVAVVPLSGINTAANWTAYTSLGGISLNVRSLYVSDTLVIAGTTNGAARWVSGTAWQKIDTAFKSQANAITQINDSLFFATNTGVKRYYAGVTVDRSGGLPGTIVRSFVTDRQQRLWAGTEDGMAVYSNGTWRPTLFNCISSNLVNRVAVAPNGSVWTSPAWVSATTRLANTFRSGVWRSFPNLVPSIPVSSLVVDKNNNAWCGLAWWDGSNNSYIIKVDTRDSQQVFTTPRVPQNTGILAASCDDDDNKYFSAYNRAVLQVSPDDSTWTTYVDPGPVGGYANAMWIISIAQDRDGALWLGSYYNELTRFNPTNNVWSHFGPESGVPDVNVRAIAVGSDNSLWLATAQGLGHGRYDPGTGRLSTTVFNTANSRIAGNDIRTVRIDRSGNAWIASDKGLSLLSWDGRWTNFTSNDIDGVGSMLLSDDVKDIAIGPRDDAGDDIWVATSKGLNQLSSNGAAAAAAEAVTVAPNPFRPNQDHYLVFSRLPGAAAVRIFTIDGRLAGSFHGPPAPAHQLALRTGTDLDLSALPSGLYLCHISAPGARTVVVKLVIVR